MASTSINYAADTQATITLASLASSATFVAGREGTVFDNTSTKYIDILLSGKITVGTTPIADTQILIYAFTPTNDTPTYPDVMDGTDSDETLTSVGVGMGFLKLIAALDVDSATSDRTYYFGQVSVANAFGGTLPPKFGLFVTHNTNVALNSTGSNHEISLLGVKYDTA